MDAFKLKLLSNQVILEEEPHTNHSNQISKAGKFVEFDLTNFKFGIDPGIFILSSTHSIFNFDLLSSQFLKVFTPPPESGTILS
jgi:hypothetical protein